ncbi:MAG: SUMF1/EgtB/PvdO family nonheme iron enzyme [Thermoanaerobaculia bacterium]|nr:SUMF1/EgtB/PvdO family nonheme iron enzyme [Thermoanaerobaculia bacterium]
MIEGLSQIEVTFAADVSERFPADPPLGSDSENRNGLAVFQVRGAIPREVRSLSFDNDAQLQRGEDLFLLGFPEMTTSPLTLRAAFAGPNGNLLQLDRGVGDGLSGGPVLRRGKVVAVVTSTDPQLTVAVKSLVARDAVASWPVRLGVSTAIPPPVEPPCRPRQEKTIDGIDFIRICPDAFTMLGSTSKVTLSQFWIAKTETTSEQYSRFKVDHAGQADLPATDARWTDAKAFCEKLDGGRLPTEAEWEYAARAGTKTTWSFGDAEKLRDYAWYDKNSGNEPHPVGTKKPNAWGLYDMHGNVWEWVAAWDGTYPTAAQASLPGAATREYHGRRGGSFLETPEGLRSSSRSWGQPEARGRDIGFRCVIAPRRQP